MGKYLGPYPSVSFPEQVADKALPPLIGVFSGQLTVDTYNIPLGMVRTAGNVTDVAASVLESGRDDSNALSLEIDILINGTTCLTTKPKILGNKGKAGVSKTTIASGEGITEAVVDGSASSFSAGDIITAKLDITRTSTPTTEIQNVAILVELEPDA